MLGTACYGICVFVSNLILLIQTHNFTRYGEILIVLSMVAFFLILLIESKWQWSLFAPVNHMFSNMLGCPTIWFSMILATGSICLVEGLKQALIRGLHMWKDPSPKEDQISELYSNFSSQVNSSHAKSLDTNKLKSQKSFAFSQDPKAG